MRWRVAAWRRETVAGFPVDDLALAGLLCAVAVVSVLTGNPDEGPAAITLPAAVLITGGLVWRTRSPMLSVLLAIVAGAAQTLLSQPMGSLWSLAVYAIVVYSAAAHYPEGKAALAGILMVGALLVEERIGNGVDYLFIVLLFGGIWLLGRASRLWRTRVRHAEQHEQDSARLAVAEERVRIARELHDIVAHSLSVIAVQSDAAEAALDAHPALAREPLRAIRASARDSLGEIRRMLHALRTEDDDGQPPGLAALGALLESAGSAGLPVQLQSDAEPAALPAVIDLTAYRIIQEALTNVINHAGPVPTTVTISTDTDSIRLEVTNRGAGQGIRRHGGTGLGLIGIRERVAALNGTLTAGRSADGGFRISATLPLNPEVP
ncbi:MAG: histidine kinase [Microbacteriaceae bacterium]